MEPSRAAPSPTRGPFTLTSSAFEDGGHIPREATCDGADRSPALAWVGVPEGAAALVLFLDDPDAHDFVHWTVLDLPVDASGAGALPAGVHADAATPQQGRNDFRRVGYGGPCPPSGTHHYRFRLYALAAPLGIDGHPNGDQVRTALRKASVLGRAELGASYRRQ